MNSPPNELEGLLALQMYNFINFVLTFVCMANKSRNHENFKLHSYTSSGVGQIAELENTDRRSVMTCINCCF